MVFYDGQFFNRNLYIGNKFAANNITSPDNTASKYLNKLELLYLYENSIEIIDDHTFVGFINVRDA